PLALWPDTIGEREAGGDGIDADTVGPELEGELARQRDDPALGGGVGAAARLREPAAGDGGDVDDLAAFLPLHHRHDRMAEEEGAGEVEVQELLPFLEGELVERRGRARDDRAAAHAIDEDVDVAVGVDGAPDHVLHGGGVESIGAEPERTAPGGGDLGGEPVEGGLIEIDRDHAATLAPDDTRRRATDAGASPGDQRDLTLEPHRRSALRAPVTVETPAPSSARTCGSADRAWRLPG